MDRIFEGGCACGAVRRRVPTLAVLDPEQGKGEGNHDDGGECEHRLGQGNVECSAHGVVVGLAIALAQSHGTSTITA